MISTVFSFRYNSRSLCFDLIHWQFQNRMFKPMKLIKRYMLWMMMHYNCLLGGLGCLGTALVELLGGEVDFNGSGFEVHLEVELTLVIVNVKGLGGGGRGAERT